MKLAQLLLTLGFVAGGIFLYDLLRAPAPGPVDTTLERQTPTRETAAEPSVGLEVGDDPIPPAILDGTGDDLLILDLERRLEALERRLRGSGENSAASQDVEIDEGPMDETEAAAAAEGEAEPGGWALNPTDFSRDELKDFRQKLQWVERQRRLEKAGREIWKWLSKQGVNLTPEQQRGVVVHALRYQMKAKQAGNKSGADAAAKKAEYEALSREFRDGLYDTIPSTEADRIITAIDNQRAEAEARRRAKEK